MKKKIKFYTLQIHTRNFHAAEPFTLIEVTGLNQWYFSGFSGYLSMLAWRDVRYKFKRLL